MPSLEHIARQSLEVSAPIDKNGGGPGPENPLLRNKQALVAQLGSISRSPQSMDRLHFEHNPFQQIDLLSPLETAGIVPPAVNNPNPYDSEHQGAQYQRWINENRQMFEEYRVAATKREKVIDTLYLGSRIQEIVGGRLYPRPENTIKAWSSSQKVVEFFKQEYAQRSPVDIDYKLSSSYGALLPALEETGIVPTTPRPPAEWFKWKQEQQQQWLAAHPNYAERASTLQHLYVGMLMEQTLGNL